MKNPQTTTTAVLTPFDIAFSVQVVRPIDDTELMTARACECSAKMGTASIGSAADVIDSSRLQPMFMTVARDRAADRGCTGSCDGAEDVGPPGEIRGGFSFWVSQWMELRWCDRRQTPRLPESPSSSAALERSRDDVTAGAFPTSLNSRLGATVRGDPALKSGAFRPLSWLLPSRATSPVSSLVFWPGPRRVSPGTCRICSRAA